MVAKSLLEQDAQFAGSVTEAIESLEVHPAAALLVMKALKVDAITAALMISYAEPEAMAALA